MQSDSDGNPNVFNVERNDDGSWLNNNWAKPTNKWNANNEFVFRLRKCCIPRLHGAVFALRIFQILLPSTKHFPDLIELFRNVLALLIGDKSSFPSGRNEKLERVEHEDTLDDLCHLLFLISKIGHVAHDNRYDRRIVSSLFFADRKINAKYHRRPIEPRRSEVIVGVALNPRGLHDALKIGNDLKKIFYGPRLVSLFYYGDTSLGPCFIVIVCGFFMMVVCEECYSPEKACEECKDDKGKE